MSYNTNAAHKQQESANDSELTNRYYKSDTKKAVKRSRLPGTPKHIVYAIVDCWSQDSRFPFPGVKEMAKAASVSILQVKRVLKDLVANGVLPEGQWCRFPRNAKGKITGPPIPLPPGLKIGREHVRLWDISKLQGWLHAFDLGQVEYKVGLGQRVSLAQPKGIIMIRPKGIISETDQQDTCPISDSAESPNLYEYSPSDSHDQDSVEQDPDPSTEKRDDWEDLIGDSNRAYAMALQLEEHLNPSPPAYSGSWLAKAA